MCLQLECAQCPIGTQSMPSVLDGQNVSVSVCLSVKTISVLVSVCLQSESESECLQTECVPIYDNMQIAMSEHNQKYYCEVRVN